MNKKPITKEFLQSEGFKIQKDESFSLKIENAVFHAVEIRVEIIAKDIMSSTSIKVAKTRNFATLPIDYEDQLKKLIEALKGK